MELSNPASVAAAPAADLARVARSPRVHAPDARPGVEGRGRPARRRAADAPRLRIPRRRPLDDDHGPLAQAHRPPAASGPSCAGTSAAPATSPTASRSGAERLAEESGRRIAVVGQSRGGSCARALAVRRPDLVEKVVTLGSPLRNQFDVHPGVMVQIGLLGNSRNAGRPRPLQPLVHLGRLLHPGKGRDARSAAAWRLPDVDLLAHRRDRALALLPR